MSFWNPFSSAPAPASKWAMTAVPQQQQMQQNQVNQATQMANQAGALAGQGADVARNTVGDIKSAENSVGSSTPFLQGLTGSGPMVQTGLQKTLQTQATDATNASYDNAQSASRARANASGFGYQPAADTNAAGIDTERAAALAQVPGTATLQSIQPGLTAAQTTNQQGSTYGQLGSTLNQSAQALNSSANSTTDAGNTFANMAKLYDPLGYLGLAGNLQNAGMNRQSSMQQALLAAAQKAASGGAAGAP
jgi:hypothetical protein